MRRTGFIATLAAAAALLGASLHGITSVDRTLEIAAAPRSAPAPELVREPRDCDRRDHGGREV